MPQRHALLLCFMLMCCGSFVIPVFGRFNIVIKKLKHCDNNVDYPIKGHTNIYSVGAKQYINANATFKVALDDDIRTNFTMELLVGRTYVHVVTFDEKHSCKSMHRYFGEFAYEIERTAQVVPGLCPIPPGRYHINDYLLNFDQITLQNFPFGHLRATVISIDSNKKVVTCIIGEAENEAF